MFYIVGCAKAKSDRPSIMFGHSFIPQEKQEMQSYLGQILGDFLDLRDKFKDAQTRPEEVKQRDLAVLRKHYEMKVREVYEIYKSKLNLIYAKSKKQLEPRNDIQIPEMTKDNFDLIVELLGDSGIITTGLLAFINEVQSIHLAISEEINKA